ncbi:MAG: hypothetical protein Q7U97_16160 [Rhodocyclaceae bacterium]|nr:hypothetical protein [Rhodocyclaceae bacterium]
MLRSSIGKLIAAAACLGMAGCVTAPMDERARLMDIPWASSHSDVAFTISTAARRTATCEENTDCPTQSERDATMQFALQVHWVADALQVGVRFLYPDNAWGDPASPGNRFDVYVVGGAELGSASSANGRIAMNEAMGIAAVRRLPGLRHRPRNGPRDRASP